MPRYTVTLVDEVTLIEFEGVVMTRRFWWLGAVDALLLRGHRNFVVSLEKTKLRTAADGRFVDELAQHVLGNDGQVAFVPPPGRRAGAKVRSIARNHHALAAPTVESAIDAVRLTQSSRGEH